MKVMNLKALRNKTKKKYSQYLLYTVDRKKITFQDSNMENTLRKKNGEFLFICIYRVLTKSVSSQIISDTN